MTDRPRIGRREEDNKKTCAATRSEFAQIPDSGVTLRCHPFRV
jgi:hypothetical protein